MWDNVKEFYHTALKHKLTMFIWSDRRVDKLGRKGRMVLFWFILLFCFSCHLCFFFLKKTPKKKKNPLRKASKLV